MTSKRQRAAANGKGSEGSRRAAATIESGPGACPTLTPMGREVASSMAYMLDGALGMVGETLQDVVRSVEPIANEPAFRFHIELSLEPGRTCWREIVVPQDWTSYDLHEAVQSCFLWWDYHLFDFKLRMRGRQVEIGNLDRGGADSMFSYMQTGGGERESLDAASTPLTDAFPRCERRCTRTTTATAGSTASGSSRPSRSIGASPSARAASVTRLPRTWAGLTASRSPCASWQTSATPTIRPSRNGRIASSSSDIASPP